MHENNADNPETDRERKTRARTNAYYRKPTVFWQVYPKQPPAMEQGELQLDELPATEACSVMDSLLEQLSNKPESLWYAWKESVQ